VLETRCELTFQILVIRKREVIFCASACSQRITSNDSSETVCLRYASRDNKQLQAASSSITNAATSAAIRACLDVIIAVFDWPFRNNVEEDSSGGDGVRVVGLPLSWRESFLLHVDELITYSFDLYTQLAPVNASISQKVRLVIGLPKLCAALACVN
jgi:hypothetical protein